MHRRLGPMAKQSLQARRALADEADPFVTLLCRLLDASRHWFWPALPALIGACLGWRALSGTLAPRQKGFRV